MTWAKVQETKEFRNASEALSQYLPDLAIPKIRTLLAKKDLEANAKASLLTLLGEAEVRAGRSEQALETLSDPALREFSPAHLWRSYALGRQGRYQEAVDALSRIDRKSMLDEANLRTAILQSALGEEEAAIDRLVPLTNSSDPDIVRKASFQLAGLAIDQDNIDLASRTLENLKPGEPREEGLVLYLKGRIQLAKNERIAAIRTFQTLVNSPVEELMLPKALYHAATLSLADSLALGENYGAGIASLLETLEKNPRSPEMTGIFQRLKLWALKSESEIPVLIEKLKTWAPNPQTSSTDPATNDEKTAENLAASPSQQNLSRRSVNALHLIATFNLRSVDPATRALALKQFDQVQEAAGPQDHNLITDSLIQLGMSELQNGNPGAALANFQLLRDEARTPAMRAYGEAFIGQVHLAMNDAGEASKAYLAASTLAEEANLEEVEVAASLNAGLAMLSMNQDQALEELTNDLANQEARAWILLERGLNLAAAGKPAARTLLSNFLAEYPENPRRAEAALALAESALLPPQNLPLAESQIANLKFDLVTQPVFFGRLVLVNLALGQGADKANEFLVKYPAHELAPRILFQLGQSYRRKDDKENGTIGEAFYTFEKFLTAYPDHELVDAARFLSALTATASGTEASVTTALNRYQELAEGNGPLAHEARIARASFLIDRDQKELALSEIEAALKTQNLPATDRYRLLILAADAAGQMNEYDRALEFYDLLLKMPELPLAWAHRAYFQRGRIFESMGPDHDGDALESYLVVVDREVDPGKTSALEWKWFDKCGIDGALSLLQKEQKWKAAISLATRLARSGSPRAADAAAIADRISLEQHEFGIGR